MKAGIALLCLLLAGAASAGAQNGGSSKGVAGELAVGDAAPPFSLAGSDGRTHSLAEHAGVRGVVLAWFPKAFTPG